MVLERMIWKSSGRLNLSRSAFANCSARSDCAPVIPNEGARRMDNSTHSPSRVKPTLPKRLPLDPFMSRKPRCNLAGAVTETVRTPVLIVGSPVLASGLAASIRTTTRSVKVYIATQTEHRKDFRNQCSISKHWDRTYNVMQHADCRFTDFRIQIPTTNV